MCERNNILLEEVNAAGHKFSKEPTHPNSEQDKSFADIEKQLAEQFSKELGFNRDSKNNGGSQGFSNSGFGNPNGGFGNPNQGFGDQSGQGGFYNNNPNYPGYCDNSNQSNKYDFNPYKGTSSLNHGPSYYTPS